MYSMSTFNLPEFQSEVTFPASLGYPSLDIWGNGGPEKGSYVLWYP
jgi:hypothetical protein